MHKFITKMQIFSFLLWHTRPKSLIDVPAVTDDFLFAMKKLRSIFTGAKKCGGEKTHNLTNLEDVQNTQGYRLNQNLLL